ncbi:hypothetical protein L2E82_40886 [Cichorium intybus]|uniref:Uncharacterized protein n=1 Tax=Cichorium intybus TaxID=13427 RepID=A0ACB9AMK9_CICIN|nr:hypothetical protein L2E82_40886 [Cichorium intybus]
MLSVIAYVLALTCTAIFNVSPTKANNELKTYIVQLTLPEGLEFCQPKDLEGWYKSILFESASISNEKPSMVHMYHHVITGFAAKMSVQQAKGMENMEGVLSVRPEGVFELHTTRSPHFLGLRQNTGFWKASNYGKGIIIGLLDSGITPGHPSFNDEGMPPPPARWKGKCEVAGCNNKLIGVKNFFPGATTPVDEDGHGTHTSSTAAGSPVDDANVFGNANGTATGIAPLAHLAMYRVCDGICTESALAAGFDAAIEDGVDVLSISIGGGYRQLYNDIIDIASFAATQKGIFVSCSAGNSGPTNATLSNEAPWILTVGASTIDRRIRTSVYLGNKKLYDGESLYQPKDFNHKFRPLVYPGKDGDTNAANCLEGSLEQIDVKGKVVLCDMGWSSGVEKSEVVKAAGGAAVILANDKVSGATTIAEANVIPASNVGYREGIEIKKYFNSTYYPIASILFRGTVLGINTTPEVAFFSSRGPNTASPGILKPDIIGPGVNILAAWSESVDNNTKFQVISGTSMACPHLAGVAALLKSDHPDWSPAVIKSAIMTTATQVNLNKHAIVDQTLLPADVFAIGSGHVDPSKSNDPGLVFDIQPSEYIPYLCGLGYTPKQIELITKKKVSCLKTIAEAQLNYPSFVVSLKRGDSKTYSRMVTNVGMPNSTYTVGEIHVPHGVKAVVGGLSQQLSFTAMHHKLTYNITFSRDPLAKVNVHYGQGHMTWVSSSYSVRTPFSFKFE